MSSGLVEVWVLLSTFNKPQHYWHTIYTTYNTNGIVVITPPGYCLEKKKQERGTEMKDITCMAYILSANMCFTVG